jgi:Glyoxalase-like domain
MARPGAALIPDGGRARAAMSVGRATVLAMMFWQLTIDASNPARLARFWAQALGYQGAPPMEPKTTWQAHYQSRLGAQTAFDDRLFDPAGLRPPIWFQEVPEAKAGKNRLHLDLYPTGRDGALPLGRRIEIVEAKVAELVGLGASVERRTREDDDPEDPVYYVVMHDPEGNEFCVS